MLNSNHLNWRYTQRHLILLPTSPTVVKRMENYRSLVRESHRFKESNDCAVIAVAVAIKMGYDEAWRLFDAMGRKSRDGTPMVITKRVLASQGYTLHSAYRYNPFQHPKPNRYTIRTVAPMFPRGTFLIRTRDHILCIDDGVVEDWSVNRLLRVISVDEVCLKGEQPSYRPPADPLPHRAAPGTEAALIWHVADEMLSESGVPLEVPAIRKLRIAIMDRLVSEYDVKRTTASVALGKWQKYILGSK